MARLSIGEPLLLVIRETIFYWSWEVQHNQVDKSNYYWNIREMVMASRDKFNCGNSNSTSEFSEIENPKLSKILFDYRFFFILCSVVPLINDISLQIFLILTKYWCAVPIFTSLLTRVLVTIFIISHNTI